MATVAPTIFSCHPRRVDYHHDTTFFGLGFSKEDAIADAKRRGGTAFGRVKVLTQRLQGEAAWLKFQVVGSLLMAEGSRSLIDVEVAALELLGRNPHIYGRVTPILTNPTHRPISDARVDRHGLGVLAQRKNVDGAIANHQKLASGAEP